MLYNICNRFVVKDDNIVTSNFSGKDYNKTMKLNERRGDQMKQRQRLKRIAALFMTGILFACMGCQNVQGPVSSGNVADSQQGATSSQSVQSEKNEVFSKPEVPVSSEPEKAVWDVGLLNGQTITQISDGGSVFLSDKGEVYIATYMTHLFGLEGSNSTRVMRMRLEEPAKLVAQGNERFFAVGESNTIYYWGYPLTGDPTSEAYYNDFSLKEIPFDKNIVDLSVGSELCAITDEGEAYTIGGGLLYGYGYASSTMNSMEITPKKLHAPLPVTLPEKVKKMIAGSTSFFAIGQSGTLYYAPLIQEATAYSEEATKNLPHPLDSQVLQKVPLDFKVKDVRQFSNFILLLSENGDVYIWNYMDSIRDASIGTSGFKMNFTKIPVEGIATLSATRNENAWGAVLQSRSGILYRIFYDRPGMQDFDQTVKIQVEKLNIPFAVNNMVTTGQSVFLRDPDGNIYGFGNNRGGELLLEKYPTSEIAAYDALEIMPDAIKPENPVKLDLFYWEPEA